MNMIKAEFIEDNIVNADDFMGVWEPSKIYYVLDNNEDQLHEDNKNPDGHLCEVRYGICLVEFPNRLILLSGETYEPHGVSGVLKVSQTRINNVVSPVRWSATVKETDDIRAFANKNTSFRTVVELDDIIVSKI